jgi:hypothetical protein
MTSPFRHHRPGNASVLSAASGSNSCFARAQEHDAQRRSRHKVPLCDIHNLALAAIRFIRIECDANHGSAHDWHSSCSVVEADPSGEVLASCSLYLGPTQVRSDLARPSVTSERSFPRGDEPFGWRFVQHVARRYERVQCIPDLHHRRTVSPRAARFVRQLRRNEFDTGADTPVLHEARQKHRPSCTCQRGALERVLALRERRAMAQAAIESARGARGMS